MTTGAVRIIQEICELNAKSGRNCSDWCVGAIGDAEQYLFKDLKLPRDYPWCLHRRASSAREAQAIVLGFWNIGFQQTLGMIESKDPLAVQVFAYLKPLVETEPAAASVLRA